MSQGCTCKNAKEKSSTCPYCRGIGTYQSHNEGYIVNSANHLNDSQCGRQDPNYGNYDNYGDDQNYGNYPNHRNYQDPDPAYSDYYHGNQYNQDQYRPNGDDENANSRPSDVTKSLLKAIALFTAGCFLTMQLISVANELG